MIAGDPSQVLCGISPALCRHSIGATIDLMDLSNGAKRGTGDVGHAWENFVVEQVYPEPGQKARSEYRNYQSTTRETVRRFYEENHRHQTYDFVRAKRAEFLALQHRR